MKDFFKSPLLAITGYLLAAAFNLPHLVEAYIKTGVDILPGWYPWIMFIVVDLGILILAIKRHETGAGIFAFVVFLLNLYVFWGKSPVPINPEWHALVYYLPGLFIASIPAFFVFWFSSLISDDIFDAETHDIQKESLKKDAEDARKEMETLRKKMETLLTNAETQRKKAESVRKEMELLKEYAGKSKDTLRKTIDNRRKKIRENGIATEEREELEMQIRIMEIASGKR